MSDTTKEVLWSSKNCNKGCLILYWLYCICCTDCTVSVVLIWLYWIHCTDCTVSFVLVALYQLYWFSCINGILYCIWCTLGERIRPQIDVSYEYVEEGDALDLRCNVRVSFQISSPDLSLDLYKYKYKYNTNTNTNCVYKINCPKNLEYRIILKVVIWYICKTTQIIFLGLTIKKCVLFVNLLPDVLGLYFLHK